MSKPKTRRAKMSKPNNKKSKTEQKKPARTKMSKKFEIRMVFEKTTEGTSMMKKACHHYARSCVQNPLISLQKFVINDEELAYC